MKDANTYTWWGCDGDWTIDDGVDYPHLAWEDMPGEIITDQSYFYGGGSGTENEPYLIYTAEQLNTIGHVVCDWDAHFKLMVDIDLSGYTGTAFNIVGNRGNGFSGVFDGDGHTISKFSYNSSGVNGIGFFRYLGGGGEIKNVVLAGPNIHGGTGNEVGSLAGTSTGAITDCRAIGATVSGSKNVGGLVGLNSVFGIVTGCGAERATVSGTRYIGGLVGQNGERGWHNGTISKSYSTGSVSGENAIGGLVGFNFHGTITQSYSSATASGSGVNTGGLLGGNWDNINNCYATGAVHGNEDVGGLAGLYYGVISNCYSTGSVSGNTDVGGLLGWGSGSGKVFGSFWDEETSGQTTSAGGTPKTTAQMQNPLTFIYSGWDFVGETTNGTEDIWYCDEPNYPQLSWEAVLSPSVDMDELWMYQNLPGQSNSDLTAGVSVTDDPMGNTTYSYVWEIVQPGDVTLAPVTVAGGGAGDAYWTFAARGCDEPGGLSDSGETFTVRVTITGDDYGNTGQAEAEFGIALLGDVNNDAIINVADRSIANAFWRMGSAGPYTLRDCD
ncbi:MAG: GLUG motif-containing protein, partial [Planctomycetota bacterium]